MAHQATDNDSESWNPASRPENNNSSATMSSIQGGLSDPIAANKPKDGSLDDIVSPRSEDFSAWDMSEEVDAIQPQYTSLDVLVNNASPVVDQPVCLETDSVDKKSQNSIEDFHTTIAPSIENADTALSPTLPEPRPAQPVQTEAPSVQPGVEASNSSFTTIDGPVDVQTERLDTAVPTVAPEQETTESTFVRDTTPREEQTIAPEPTLDTLEHQNTTHSTPTEELFPRTDDGNTDSENPWTTFEKDLSNTLPSTEEATPLRKTSHTIPEFASTSTQIQDADEPKFVEEVVRPSPEETASTGATFDEESTDIFNSTEKAIAPTENEEVDDVSRSIIVGSENTDSPAPIMEAFIPTNEAHPVSAAADVDTANQDQPFWTSEPSGEVDCDEDDFFNQLNSQTKPIFAPPEAESRFEEGVPLLDESTPASPQRSLVEDKSIENVFSEDDDDDADGFFSSAPKLEDKNGDEDFFGSTSKEEAEEQPVVHLALKSTSLVLESAGFALDSPVSDASAAAQFDDALKAASMEPQTTADPSEEELAARWEAELADSLDDALDDDLAARWEAALDDDDILLETETAQSVSAQENIDQTPIRPTHNGLSADLNSPFQTPQAFSQPRPVPNIYTPHQPSTGDLLQGVPLPGTAPPATGPMSSYFSQPPQNPVAIRGESFAERSKQGYKSPYDLPDDISRPRKPVAAYKPVPATVTSMPPPPHLGVSGIPIPAAAGFPTTAAPPSSVSAPPAPKSFFEELPVGPPRSRPASSGRYTPNPQAAPAMTGSSLPPPQVQYAPAAPPAPQHVALPIQSTLQPPEQLDLYASLASSAPAGPPAIARYSPQPPGSQVPPKPPSLPRYSPAPPPTSSVRSRYASQPLNVPGQNLPFQPRTSSPLAHHEKVSYQPDHLHKPPYLEPAINLSPPRGQRAGFGQIPPSGPPYHNGPASPPRRESAGSPVQPSPPQSRYAPQEYLNEFAQRLAPAPEHAPPAPVTNVYMSPPPSDIQMGPLRRSQTQSPARDLTSPRSYGQNIDAIQRPASVQVSGSPTKTVNPYASVQAASQNRAPTQHLEFIVPNDGQEHDPLERWKGAPIFKFGFGGSIASCFPKHIPRYSAGQAAPMIQPTLGEPKISQLSEWLPSADNIVQHPGPLKAKAKKKDLVTWLSSKIATFENLNLPTYEQVQSDTRKRQEEKTLLWKVVKLLVENDGNLDSSLEIQKSLRQIIFPNLPIPDADGSYTSSLAASGGFAPSELPSQPDAVDAQWLEELRLHLICGDREKAVWSAVDRRLWGHAMIISSTMDRSISKQVAQEFVRREVRSKSANTESLAALYEIFAGNIEESIDELVPPSARAGLQLISKADGQGSTKNALEGLDKWRDTLGLVLSNRSSEDHQALFSLGHLLTSYGRTEAAHICYIFSRAAVFGGPDDPKANITLLGADHQRCPSSLMDEDAILLTEAYEYATSVLSNSPTAQLPHLLAFKVLNARCLVDHGRNLEAQGYCDAVAAALKATTRPSPYYHQHLFAEVEELSARLRQTTSDSGSWISRPSMEKVSGSMWARFNSFVVGDDSDAASTGSGKGGPPTISRSPSVSDIYGSYPGAAAGVQPIPTSGPSKYHPSSQYAPNASPEQFKGRSSMDSQRSASYFPPVGQRRSSQELSPSIDQQISYGAPVYGSPNAGGYQATPPQSSYVPLAPVEEAMSPTEAPSAAQPVVNGLFYQPPGQAATSTESPYYQGPPGMPAGIPDSESPYAPPVASSSYEPVSYEPVSAGVDMGYVAQEDDPSSTVEQPKKQSIMDDDDDDLAARAAAIQKAENDRKANEAFAKAAEEDAKKDAQQSGKKGWFGGWFGGAKKEENNSGGGPIRAKLGEKSSFYYDKDLKKWVNKKDPGSSAPVHATPPPPRGSAPPSRTASSGSMPPKGAPPMPPMPPMSVSSSLPQSSSTAAPPSLSSSPGFSGLAPRSASTGAAMPTPPGSSSGPPPRPSSSLTHASSIDDLIGAPQARKGNAVRGKKKGRYVDVMAQ
ncbi:COPII coat assembly protein, Sec16 [Penicillium italicum]|uniref:Protein transport protein sec16 n=1 Tax=Penicillium italicum TaxID=40296 RepID=A0A0A2L2P9_PENIT|nr:COPII coat assembly protein, Sec16 [Penicillium italicum]